MAFSLPQTASPFHQTILRLLPRSSSVSCFENSARPVTGCPAWTHSIWHAHRSTDFCHQSPVTSHSGLCHLVNPGFLSWLGATSGLVLAQTEIKENRKQKMDYSARRGRDRGCESGNTSAKPWKEETCILVANIQGGGGSRGVITENKKKGEGDKSLSTSGRASNH